MVRSGKHLSSFLIPSALISPRGWMIMRLPWPCRILAIAQALTTTGLQEPATFATIFVSGHRVFQEPGPFFISCLTMTALGILLQHNSSQNGPTHLITQEPIDSNTHLTMDFYSIIVTNLL